MSERRWWLVTEASTTAHDMMHGAVFVEAATDEEAAARGMAMLWEEAWARSEGGEPEPVHDVAVFEGVGRRWRATVGAELVPDEFQCCGGMPATPLGTYDEHTATCPTKTPQSYSGRDGHEKQEPSA